MTTIKINELPEQTFTSQIIDNCFYVENMNTPLMKRVKLQNVIDCIIEKAKKEGLKIKFLDDVILLSR